MLNSSDKSPSANHATISYPVTSNNVQLRLIHIFAWTVLSIIFLAIQRWTFAAEELEDQLSDSLFVVVD